MAHPPKPRPAPDPAAGSPEEQLRALHAKLDALGERVTKLDKSKRWVSMMQALLVASAVPITAGVFSTCADRRERELKIYEQNLALVDRAANFDKDVRYRQAIVTYMQALNDQRPKDDGIGKWLSTNHALLTQEKKDKQDKKEALEAKVLETTKKANEIGEILQKTAKKDEALTDDVVKQIAKKVETLEEELPSAMEAQAELEQVNKSLGEVPVAPTILETPLVQPTSPGEEWIVQFGTDRTLAAAEHEAKKLAKLELDVHVYFSNRYYFTTVGPYPTREEAERARGEIKQRYDKAMQIKTLGSLCPSSVRLRQSDAFEVRLCSPSKG